MNYRKFIGKEVSIISFGTSTYVRGKLNPEKDSNSGKLVLEEAINKGINVVHSNPNLETQTTTSEVYKKINANIYNLIKIELPHNLDYKFIKSLFEEKIKSSMNNLGIDSLFAVIYERDEKNSDKKELTSKEATKTNYLLINNIFHDLSKKYNLFAIGVMLKNDFEFEVATDIKVFDFFSSYLNFHDSWIIKNFDFLLKEKIDLIGVKPLKYGVFTDEFRDSRNLADPYRKKNYLETFNYYDKLCSWIDEYFDHNNITSIATNFSISHPAVKTVVFGVSSESHLHQLMNYKILNEHEFHLIEQKLREIKELK